MALPHDMTREFSLKMKPSFCRRTRRLGHVIPNVFSPFFHYLCGMFESRCLANMCHGHSSIALNLARALRPLLFGLVATANTSWAASAPHDMRETTTELIYNFALLSQTPDRLPLEAYHICAFEEDLGYLQSTTLESQKLQNLSVFLVPLKTIADVKRCNLLYIQDFTPQKPLELQQSIQKDAVLTVVHTGNKFAEHGHILVSNQDKRYQFDLRIQPAKQAGIVFDARLLKLATNIIND